MDAHLNLVWWWSHCVAKFTVTMGTFRESMGHWSHWSWLMRKWLTPFLPHWSLFSPCHCLPLHSLSPVAYHHHLCHHGCIVMVLVIAQQAHIHIHRSLMWYVLGLAIYFDVLFPSFCFNGANTLPEWQGSGKGFLVELFVYIYLLFVRVVVVYCWRRPLWPKRRFG